MSSCSDNSIDLQKPRDLRVQNVISLPFDPLAIKTMAEYNFALLTNRNWFEYDDGRKALPGIIEHWQFNADLGGYEFTISSSAKWSDGSQINADDLYYNLTRAVSLKTSYGDAVASVIRLSSFKKISPKVFFIGTTSKKPSLSFFERMGSIFLAIVHPHDVDSASHQVISNKWSSGPYVLKSASANQIDLVPNKYIPHPSKSPETISFGQSQHPFDLESFLNESSWENILQLTSFVPKEWETKIKANQMPYWTRGHDRVSLFRPGFGRKLRRGRQIVRAVHASISANPISASLPFNVSAAHSLQPETYPLFHPKAPPSNTKFPTGKIHILSSDTAVFKFHKEALSKYFTRIGVDATWDELPFAEYLKHVSSSENHDLILLNFGVADPEPATWISLIRQAKFIEFDREDSNEFKRILKNSESRNSSDEFKKMLAGIITKGGYVPLFFGSTMALAHHKISFQNIRELDETVNLSKVIFE